MHYRFKCGHFIEADSFEEAKKAFIDKLEAEVEDIARWHKCTCLGFQHRFGCPIALEEGIPF